MRQTEGNSERERGSLEEKLGRVALERRKRATVDNGAKEKSASARSMRGTDELMEVKES